MECGTISELYFMALSILICGFECVMFSKIFYRAGKFRDCIVARLLPYYLAVFK